MSLNKFENGYILNEIQELDEHTFWCYVFKLYESSNQLISAASDGLNIFWNLNQQGQWSKDINCLHLNQNEDILISESVDKTIKFLERKQKYWICQQTIQTDFWVEGLGLADQSNILIVCGYDKPENLMISQFDQLNGNNIKNQNRKLWNKIVLHQLKYI